MTINTIQTITNILDENRKIIRTTTVESIVLYPENGKGIKQISTGRIFTQAVNIGTRGKLKDYIEIDL